MFRNKNFLNKFCEDYKQSTNLYDNQFMTRLNNFIRESVYEQIVIKLQK